MKQQYYMGYPSCRRQLQRNMQNMQFWNRGAVEYSVNKGTAHSPKYKTRYIMPIFPIAFSPISQEDPKLVDVLLLNESSV